MATSDLRRFFFYQDYIWTPADFTNFQNWTWGAFQTVFEGFGPAVVKGLRPSPSGGLSVTFSSGIAIGGVGQSLYAPTALTANIPSPGLSAQNSLVILRPTSTNGTIIPTPDNPSIPVPLHEFESFDLLVLSKAPSFQNDYPATQAGDVVLIGVQLPPSASVINQSNLDYGVVSLFRKRPSTIKVITSGYTAVPTMDDIIEANFATASGVVQLPPAADAAGYSVTVIKVDASANQVAVSGNNAETINGSNVASLGTQFDAMNLYSNGLAWRSISTGGGGGSANFVSEVPAGLVNNSNTSFALSQTPLNKDGIFFYVDNAVLEKTDFTLSGLNVNITNLDFRPDFGQSVYVKYVIAGSGGGGGGGGPTARTTNVVSSNFVIPTLTNDYILNADTSAGPLNVTLPNATPSNGWMAMIKNIGSPVNAITVMTTGGQFIDGAPTDTINTVYEGHQYFAVSGNWDNF